MKMKIFGAVLISILFLLQAHAADTKVGRISVKVTNLDVEKGGKVQIGLFVSRGFPEPGKEIQGASIDVKATSASCIFKNVPAGKYAVGVFQDENKDGRLNKNFLGIPKERYGFSQNKYSMFGPPAFEDVSFRLKNGETITLTINLK